MDLGRRPGAPCTFPVSLALKVMLDLNPIQKVCSTPLGRWQTHRTWPRPAQVQACAPVCRTSQQVALHLGACACEGIDVGSSQETQKGLLEKVLQEADVGVGMGALAREWQGGVAVQEGPELRPGLSSCWMWCIYRNGRTW